MSNRTARCAKCKNRWYRCECWPPCGARFRAAPSAGCVLVFGHAGKHDNGTYLWDERSVVVFSARHRDLVGL